MNLASPRKGFSTMAVFPRSVSSIAVAGGGLALFLIFASWVLISYPIGYTFQGFLLGIDNSRKYLLPGDNNSELVLPRLPALQDGIHGLADPKPSSVADDAVTKGLEAEPFSSSDSPSAPGAKKVDQITAPVSSLAYDSSREPKKPISISVSPKVSGAMKMPQPPLSGLSNTSKSLGQEANGSPLASSLNLPDGKLDSSTNSTEVTSPSPFPPLAGKSSKIDSVYSDTCDLYNGKWFYDSAGPLYTNNTCPVLTQMQNCQGNGRPDKDYENWRWKPSQCDLPRFNGTKFLELMRGKTLAFIGDSVARNQMESMLCILWQVEVPKNRGNRRMQRWYFRSTSVMIVRIWSSWLVHKTPQAFDFAPEGVIKLHLDKPDEDFMEYLPSFDVVVLSSGHWFAKQSVYIYNNEIVGGQLWWPDNSRPRKIDNIEAFRISVQTILTAIVNHPSYTGLTIVRSYSPDHYEGGAWNTGGSCTGKVKPALDSELVPSGFTDAMHQKQVMGFSEAIKSQTNKSKLKLMDITKAFSYRHDGHPGPYRSLDPNKITKRGPNGQPPPQDCLHWCMPGPVDTWNELVLENIRREFEVIDKAPV
ncbi:protein YLS7-like [Telopea speciosissima]|uniref:protein YLS7-like n=1 Tax=Telopea speciosissima TaxID=54955 RepID=UPI001CC35C63|nr:protein YLS7-like [Telopea speciosissima]XP_043720678.1 protein YLS7-like [Telopea speciosissima]